MLRYNAIGVFVVGVIVVILGATKILPHMTGTGGGLILLGGLLFGLSFVPKPETADSVPMSAFERLTKIFYAPTEVFQNLRRHPSWFAAILVISVLSTVYINIFYNYVGADRITNYTVDKIADSGWVPADKVAEVRSETLETNTSPVARAGTAISGFVGQTFLHAFLGAIFLLFALAMGGKMNFWQAFAASVYASFPIAVIRYLLSSGLIFLKDPTDIHPIIGQSGVVQDNLSFLVAPSEHPTIYVLLASLGIFTFYWLWLCATGLKNTGERVSATTAWTATIFVFVIQLLFGVVSSLLFPSFF